MSIMSEGDSVSLREESVWFGKGANPGSTQTIGEVVGKEGDWFIVEWPDLQETNYRHADLDKITP